MTAAVVTVVVFRPPDRSVSQFNVELGDMLDQMLAANTDRLLLCGDFNRPGVNSTSADADLIETLDVHGLI